MAKEADSRAMWAGAGPHIAIFGFAQRTPGVQISRNLRSSSVNKPLDVASEELAAKVNQESVSQT